MRRGSTPTHTFTLPFDVSMVAKLRVIYAQDEQRVLVKTDEDGTLEGNTFVVKLTQEETMLFNCKKTVEIQIRVLTPGGDVPISDIIRIPVERCLDSEVLV